MSSIFLGEVSDAQSPSQVNVSASRVFARSSGLRFTTYIYYASDLPLSRRLMSTHLSPNGLYAAESSGV
jgi:hypothetical protein